MPIAQKTLNFIKALTTFNSMTMMDEKVYLHNCCFNLHFLGFHRAWATSDMFIIHMYYLFLYKFSVNQFWLFFSHWFVSVLYIWWILTFVCYICWKNVFSWSVTQTLQEIKLCIMGKKKKRILLYHRWYDYIHKYLKTPKGNFRIVE